MKEKNENKLDRLFKDGVSGSRDHFAFREEDWESMEQLLDKQAGKKVIPFRIIYFASGIAALLLLAIGLYFYSNNDKTDPAITNLHSKNTKTQPKPAVDQAGNPVKAPANPASVQPESFGSTNRAQQQKSATQNVLSYNNVAPLVTNTKKDTFYRKANSLAANNSSANLAKVVKSTDEKLDDNATNNLAATGTKLSNSHNVISGVDTSNGKNQLASSNNKSQSNIASTQTPDTPDHSAAEQKAKVEMAAIKSSAIKYRPQFSISVLAASDANAVNSFGHSQTGTNYGLQLSLRVTKKFTISTGASYAIKPYSTDMGSYTSSYSPTVSPVNIQANCKVLDIPLNISYQLYSKGRNAISLGTGLSSYFMLKENYQFNYSAQSGLEPSNLEVRNQNTHLFSVININANYQRRVNSKFGLVVQPYMKLPVTGIGNGKVDLKSTGVAVGVNWTVGSRR
ncbi:hypothetical protein [Mucilaginibacter sp. FT3.2]|uniref:hypothetical protein n=1 Tax=Mucilaginibacter sp. FT3.2 TaxID=2723090 RepID=UPI00160EC905|nr:hypothetical protein [Mucilaginibacter sp. FT3.2]MBB6233549.1 hypothetical protein [Mucilaginibacter sp. FT3.2]